MWGADEGLRASEGTGEEVTAVAEGEKTVAGTRVAVAEEVGRSGWIQTSGALSHLFPQAKPLFRSTRSLPTVETSPPPGPQTYAEYALSGPPGGAEATRPVGPEPLAGETPNQAPKPGAKSNSIIVSPRQVRTGMEKWDFGLSGGKCIFKEGFLVGKEGLSSTCYALNSTIHPFS